MREKLEVPSIEAPAGMTTGERAMRVDLAAAFRLVHWLRIWLRSCMRWRAGSGSVRSA